MGALTIMTLFTASAALLLCGVAVSAAASHESELRKQLASGYDAQALPDVLTNVSVRFTILHLDMDESKQALMLDSWVVMEWQDQRLQWETSLYPDVDKLTFSADSVWRPDIMLYNNANMQIVNPLSNNNVLAFPTGKMMHVPTANFPAMCVLDMTYWPHDVHNCSAKFGSWVHSGHTLNLFQKDDAPEVEFELTTKENGENSLSRGTWEVLSSSVSRNIKYYSCCPEPYIDLTIEFVVQRNAPAFTWTVKVPAVALSVLTGVLFLFPPGSVEKIVAGTLIIILDMQFLSLTNSVVAHSPSHTPLIVQLVSEQLLLSLVCVLVSALVVRLVRDPPSDSPMSCLQRPVSMLASCLCLSGYRSLASKSVDGAYPRSMKGEELEMAEERGMVSSSPSVPARVSGEQAEWLLLGAVLDRLLFIVYTVVIVIKLANYNAIL